MKINPAEILKFLCLPCRGRKGQGLIELCIVIPYLMLMIFGIVDLGKALNAYLILSNGAREGAHYASKVDVTNAANLTHVRNRVNAFLLLANAPPPPDKWIDLSTVNVSWSTRTDVDDPAIIRYVTVRVTSDFDFHYFNFLDLMPTVTLSAENTMPVVYKN
jgi:Flp pilus assembly protein TadG